MRESYPAAPHQPHFDQRISRSEIKLDVLLPLCGSIEATALSTWLRESSSVFGFWLVLSIHAIGMGLAVGASGLIAMRFLGLASDLPLAPLRRLYPLIWAGFWLQVGSGIGLLIAYPTKNLTNVDFYFKLAFIAAAMVAMVRLKRVVFDEPNLSEATMVARGRLLVVGALISWVAAVTSGRLLAYTATYSTYPG